MKKYIISSVVPGADLNHKFLKSIANFCHIENAEALFIPTKELYKDEFISEDILPYGQVIEKDINLNSNIAISTILISPDQVDPITGLDRVGHHESSVIYASPKQRLKSVASPSTAYPRCLMTTGAVTMPYYKSTKQAQLAKLDHVMGAIVVEVESNKLYHFRQVQASPDGSFIDLGYRYTVAGKKEKVAAAALVAGDWHVGFTDPAVSKATDDMLKKFNPKHLILHDFFDGISVNHHIEGKHLTKALMGDNNDLKAELKLAEQELARLGKISNNVVIVKSNHDEFLDRWLDEGKYVEDARNHIVGLELALSKARGKDPLEYAINRKRKVKNVTFLKSEQSFKVSRKKIECGMHGHLGPNGARGGSKGIEKAFISAVIGHSHTPEIIRNTWVVGTSTYLRLSYNKGPSSWANSHCIIYENGDRQIINIINGKWKHESRSPKNK